MTADASWSCLGLSTSVGSTIRQIVDTRILLTAAVPGNSMSVGSLAPPLDAITRLSRSARRRRHAPGDGPDEACELAGDRGGDDTPRTRAPALTNDAGCNSRTGPLRNKPE